MKLKQKIIITHLVILLVVLITLIILLPEILFYSNRNKETSNIMNMNEQIVSRLDTNFNELKKFAAIVQSDEQLNVMLEQSGVDHSKKLQKKIGLYLSQLGWKNQMSSYKVLAIYVNLDNGNHFETVGMRDDMRQHITQEILPIENSIKGQGIFLEPFSVKKEVDTTYFTDTSTMGYGFATGYKMRKVSGTIVIISSYDEISTMLKKIGEYSDEFQIISSKDHIIYPSKEGNHIVSGDIIKNATYGDSYLEGYQLKAEGIRTFRLSSLGNWKLVTYQSKYKIVKNAQSVMILDIIMMLAFGIVILLLMIPFINKLIQPLADISKQMKMISKGHLEAHVNIQTKDEIGAVGEAFNFMSDELQKYIKQLIEREHIEQNMRYGLLISQVDPHFIYNTMNTITYLAQKGRNQDVITVNKAMIEILRDRLRVDTENVYDTIEQEVNVVKQYIIIQQYRYTGIFKTEWDIDYSVLSKNILKNILQPIVENALFHGILTNKDENGEAIGGCIYIKIYEKDNHIVIQVHDNGCGMSEEAINVFENLEVENVRGEHIGLRNIKERIRLIYEKDYVFTINSSQNQGSTVIFKLPIIK